MLNSITYPLNNNMTIYQILAEVGNRMGATRRFHLARLFVTLQRRQIGNELLMTSNPEGVQILFRVSDSGLFD